MAENPALDRTEYDETRRWRLSFFEHWSRRFSAAAAMGDARVVVKQTAAVQVRAMRAR